MLMTTVQSKQPKKKTIKAVTWVRILYDEGTHSTINREVDENLVQQLLQERWDAKMNKNFELADQNAAALRVMRIAYHDENKTWQTLPLSDVRKTDIITTAAGRKRSKKQERNRRQAEKNRRKQAGLLGSVDGSLDGNNSVGQDIESTSRENEKSVYKKRRTKE